MKKLYTLSLCFALLVLAACGDNLFGSSSGSSNCGNDTKCLRIDAENAFRRGDDSASYAFCKKIVEIDPTASFGYFGMAKASLWWHGLNPLSVFSLAQTEEGECPFMGETMEVQNNYLQAMKKIVPVLSELDRRDTLTALYEFHKRDSLSRATKGRGFDTTFTIIVMENGNNISKTVNLEERLRDFREVFCGNSPTGACSDTTQRKGYFPISDREYKRTYFGGILLLTVFTKGILNLFDLNGDSCLTRRVGEKANPGDPKLNEKEWRKWGCIKKDGEFGYDLSLSLKCPKDENGNMSVVIDTKQIFDELQNQLNDYYEKVENCTKDCNLISVPPQIEDINKTIDDFDVDFQAVGDVLNNLGLGETMDSFGEINQSSIKEELDKYKAYAAFFKVGTHIDEDGDGCIDEELLDGQDNDGDGIANENSRLASVDPGSPLFGINAINNSMWGNNPYRDSENWERNKPIRKPVPWKIYNNSSRTSYSDLWGDPDTRLATVLAFTEDPGYWITNNMADKLEVAQDTACPPKYSLAVRKEKIGGCWSNYDDVNECKFVRYWLRRELASPDVRNNRVHSSCRTYKLLECPPK